MKLYLIHLLFFSISYCFLAAQNAEDTIMYETDTTSFIYEKIYLHTDRSFYYAGDDIWFKSYLTDAFSNQLTDQSNIVYVDLISSDSVILQQNIVWQYNGTGSGDFHLPDTTTSGRYYLRAYTRYMRNFSSNFFYMKEINIENVMNSPETRFKEKTVKPEVDIQFFPEGGSLINEVYSNVAFKAVNSEGIGCNVSGFIISSDGDTVTNFQTEHLGMGSFIFKPEKHLSYFAIGKEEKGPGFKTDFPSVFKTGIVMRINTIGQGLYLTVRTNDETLPTIRNNPLILKGISCNQVFFESALPIEKLFNSFMIPTENFPEGIVKLTIYGKDSLPLCERLVLIESKAQINVDIKSDKEIYSPREPVTLDVSIYDSLQTPVYANLSMSVIDENITKASDPYASNIASWFLIESEIKGNIEQPGYYFDHSQPDRHKHLDLLLLTQGWRDFRWKYIAPPSINPEYPPEKGFVVSGYLRKSVLNKPIVNANISLGIFDEENHFFTGTQTDSTGRFIIDGLQFTGQNTMIVSATNEEHRKRGWLLLDSLVIMPPEVSVPEFPKEELMPEIADNIEQDALFRSLIKKRYSLKDTIPIDEVVVKKKKPKAYEDDGNFRIYGEPDAVVELTDHDQGYSNIFDLLKGRVAGLSISGTYPHISVTIRGGGSPWSGTPLFLLDGMQVDMEVINSIPPSFVDKVEVLKNIGATGIFGMRGANGVISVFTKKSYEPIEKEVYYSINREITGYTNSRIFYSPKYDVPKPEHEKPDLRSTIYWEPYIITGGSKPVKINYFNADMSTKILIDLQGVTQSGIPITGKAVYKVK